MAHIKPKKKVTLATDWNNRKVQPLTYSIPAPKKKTPNKPRK